MQHFRKEMLHFLYIRTVTQLAMNFYWIKTHWLIKKWFSDFIWDIPNQNNSVYLTFDDGPTPEVTPWVLDVLKRYNIKATFFCIGNNIEKHPDIFRQLLADGHAVGNHTFNHLKGWKTTTDKYIDNFEKCEKEIQKHISEETNILTTRLFRPPYGKISPKQAAKVLKMGYEIIMWDILTCDYDAAITKERCLKNATKKVTSGSVIIFHDSVKAFSNLEYALPKAIEIIREKGFRFERIG